VIGLVIGTSLHVWTYLNRWEVMGMSLLQSESARAWQSRTERAWLLVHLHGR